MYRSIVDTVTVVLKTCRKASTFINANRDTCESIPGPKEYYRINVTVSFTEAEVSTIDLT